MPVYVLRNSFPPTEIRVLSIGVGHVIILYPDNRSSLISRKDFDKFYEEA